MERHDMRFTSAFLLIGCVAWAGELADQPLSAKSKLLFHAEQTASPGFAVEMAVYAGVLHWMDTPREWGQGGAAYGKRVASASGATAIRNVFAFALDASLREDPRYRRSAMATVSRGPDTPLARPSSRAPTGAACASRRGDSAARWERPGPAGHVASEFWPDVKHIVLRRR